MPRFKYVALAGDDKTVKGSIEAGTAVGVRTALEERELRVVSVKERRGILQLEITRKKKELKSLEERLSKGQLSKQEHRNYANMISEVKALELKLQAAARAVTQAGVG